MAVLSYDLRLGGLQAVKRGLRSLERDFGRVNRAAGKGVFGGGARRHWPARPAGAGAGPVVAQQALNQRMALEEQRHQNRLRQIRERGNQSRIRDAQRAARREAQVRAREERRAVSRRGAGSMGRTGQSVRTGLRTVGALGGGLLAIGGTYAISGAIGQEKRLLASAAALANQARGTEGGQGKSFAALQNEATRVARVEGIKSGQGPEAVVGMMRQFQAITGRFDIATQYADYMTEIGDATDAGLGDVGRTAGQIFQAINATGKNAQESIDATMKIMDAMAGQSKIGSIEMNDLAKEMGKLMSATANFKGDIGELAADMGAMAQTAIAGGASSAPEAMTALMRFADDLVQRGAASPVYKKLGVDVFEREMIGGKEVRAALKSPVEIVKQVVGATKGDLAKIQSMFGIRAKKAVDPFARIYREAEAQERGTGLAAIQKRFEQFRQVSLTEPQRKEAATARRAQADRQFDRAMAEFNDAIGRELLPTITKLVPRFTELIPTLTKIAEAGASLAEWFMENPFTGIGAIVSGAIVKDIGAAGIGSAMRAAMGLGGAGGPGGGGMGLAVGMAALGVGMAADQGIKLAKDLEEHGKDLADERANLYQLAQRQGQEYAVRTKGRFEGGEGQEVIYRDASGKMQVMEKSAFDLAMNPPDLRGGEGAGGGGAAANVPRQIEFYKRPFQMAGWDPSRSVAENLAAGAEMGGARAPYEMPMWDPGRSPQENIGAFDPATAAAFKEGAAALKESAAALKESAAGLNRTNNPSPTAAK